METKAGMILQFIDGLRGDLHVTFPRCGNVVEVVMLAYTLIHGCDPTKYQAGEITEILPPEPKASPGWRMAVNKLRMEILQKKTGWRPEPRR